MAAHSYERFDELFDVAAIRAALTVTPVVVIGGDQLTGKSTLARGAAAATGGYSLSTGRIARDYAAKQGATLDELVDRIPETLDQEVDNETALRIADPGLRPAIIEGRLPVHIGTWLTRLGKQNLLRVYLRCSERAQAVRLVGRELGVEAQIAAESGLPQTEYANLAAAKGDLAALGIDGMDRVLGHIEVKDARDRVDRERLQKLYGFDYAEAPDCEVELDTVVHDQQACVDAVVAAYRAMTG